MMTFEAGDRVRVIENVSDRNTKDKLATVIFVPSRHGASLGLEFDEPLRWSDFSGVSTGEDVYGPPGHNLNGRAESDNCLWVRKSSCKPLPKPKRGLSKFLEAHQPT